MDLKRKRIFIYVLKLLTMFFFFLYSFMIELIKSKQDGYLTKELIRERQLEKSKLRFTRIFRHENGSYCQDEASIVYSCVMTESKNENLFFC
jgi:hypothetical protein